MAALAINKSDGELVREFFRTRSEAALRALTERHVDLVFGTALRRTGDRGAAEEITQNVFLALVRKAAWLQVETSIAGWLHRTALLEARQWWRSEHRRRRREQTAASLQTTMKSNQETPEEVAALLDDALLNLKEGERQALLLRYFEQRNHREVGEALGIGEDAARKRVDKALRQLTAFFRARGLSAGSAAAVAASMEAATHAAPPALAGKTVHVALGAAIRAPWLGKLLGVGRARWAGLCLCFLLVPPAWQQARLVSAQGEQGRLVELIERLRSDHSRIQQENREVERQRFDVLAQVDAARTALNAFADPAAAGASPALFHWNEEADYVRVPKNVLRRILFDGLIDEWGLETGSRETFDRTLRRVSPTVERVLGLSAADQAAVDQVFVRYLDGYREWLGPRGQLAGFEAVADRLGRLPNSLSPRDMMKINNDTRVWVIPGGSEDQAWLGQFQLELSAILGDERAGILIGMARDDGSLGKSFRQLGAKESFLVVTPNPEGGFWLSHNSAGSWLFNTPCSFSEILSPRLEEPFDEAAARSELTDAVRKRQAEFPHEEIPPFEKIIEAQRNEAQRETARRGVIHIVLGESLPPQVVEHLRQWRALHPDVPDALASASTHP